MDGPEHYRLSEEIANEAAGKLNREGSDTSMVAALIALAQVHATLAAAAAAAGGSTGWREVFYPRPPASPGPGNREIRREGPGSTRATTPEQRIAWRPGRRIG
jgi:hypothetical protein